VKAGAPLNWVQCITDHDIKESQAVMQSPEIKLILATGGPSEYHVMTLTCIIYVSILLT
jgi:acyl-CoA reductase-like NAD-dependent aldehyde dehydrogenase